MKKFLTAAFILLGVLSSGSGASAQTNTATNTSTNTATKTATNTPTMTATKTPTNSPTMTATKTATNTTTTTATWTPSGTPTSTYTPGPGDLAKEVTLIKVAQALGAISPTGTITPGTGAASASNQATQIAIERSTGNAIATINAAFGFVPSPTATPSTFAALRNQVLFSDRFLRPDNISINFPGSNNSAWIVNPGSSIGVTNNNPAVFVSNGNDSILQDIGISDAYVQVVMGAEFIATNVGLNVRMLSDDDGIEIDNLGNGTFSIFDMASAGVTGNATTRYSPAAVTIGNNFGVEIKGRMINIYINTFLIDTINMDTAGFDNHLDAATKYGITLYGEDGSMASFTNFIIEPFKQEFLNPTPTPTPFGVMVIDPVQSTNATPIVLAQPTPGHKHDFYLTLGNGNDTVQKLGQVNTGIQYYGNFKSQPALGLQQMFFPDAIGNTTTSFTGSAGVTTDIGGFFIWHP